MKLFITGANGFIGRAVCRAAAAEGHEVLGLCRSAEMLIDGCTVAPGTLASLPWAEIENFAPDTALHTAWIATPGVYLDSPENEVLVSQSTALFEGLARRGVGHLAGVGTCIEYAPSALPLDEGTSPLAPQYPYSRAKVETSMRLREIAEGAGLTWSWLRVFYPYGAGEHPGRMPTWLMRKLAAGESVELKTPDSVKDYIHIDDTASAMLRVLEGGLIGPINIGTGAGIRILDLARTIAEVVGSDASRVSAANPPAVDPFPVTVARTGRLNDAGWQPETPLSKGLEALWNSLRL